MSEKIITSTNINNFFDSLYSKITLLDTKLINNEKEAAKLKRKLNQEITSVSRNLLLDQEIVSSYLDKSIAHLTNYKSLGSIKNDRVKHICNQFVVSSLRNIKHMDKNSIFIFNESDSALSFEFLVKDINVYRLLKFNTNLTVKEVYIYDGNTSYQLEVNDTNEYYFPIKRVTKIVIKGSSKTPSTIYYVDNIQLANLESGIFSHQEFPLNVNAQQFNVPYISPLHSFKLFSQDKFISHLHHNYNEMNDLLIDFEDDISEELSFYPISLSLYEDGHVVNPSNFSYLVDGRELSSLPNDNKRLKSIRLKFNFDPNCYYFISYLPGRSLKGVLKENKTSYYSLINAELGLTIMSESLYAKNNLILRYLC